MRQSCRYHSTISAPLCGADLAGTKSTKVLPCAVLSEEMARAQTTSYYWAYHDSHIRMSSLEAGNALYVAPMSIWNTFSTRCGGQTTSAP
jgi:hypothetical protein